MQALWVPALSELLCIDSHSAVFVHDKVLNSSTNAWE